MTTRQMRPQSGIVRTALLALVFFFLVPLFGIEGQGGAAPPKPVNDRGVVSVVSGAQADSRVENRDCREGQQRDPRGVVVQCPEAPVVHAPKPERAVSGPQDGILRLVGSSPPGTTSVDLYRIQIIRT